MMPIAERAISITDKHLRNKGLCLEEEYYNDGRAVEQCRRKAITWCRECEVELCDRHRVVVGLEPLCESCAWVAEHDLRDAMKQSKNDGQGVKLDWRPL